MPDHSRITGIAPRPDANTRFAPGGPRVEATWLDEAYARARGLDAPPLEAPGVRLVWCRGKEIGFRDLAASGDAYAIVGRHSRCDVLLATDPVVALRHLLVRATMLEDGAVAVRVLDLKTSAGFYLDDDAERRAVVACGPLAMRVGRYALVALPSGLTPASTRPPPEVLDAAVLPAGRTSVRMTTRVTSLPPAPALEDIVHDRAAPGFARVTLRHGPDWASTEVSETALDAGVLVGRADRCDHELRRVLTEGVSRTHLLIVREHGVVHAFDLASTQGVFAGGKRARRLRLPDTGATLSLAKTDPVMLEWHPRASA